MKIESCVEYDHEFICLDIYSSEGLLLSEFHSDLFVVFEIVKRHQELLSKSLKIDISIGGIVTYTYKKNWEEKNDK